MRFLKSVAVALAVMLGLMATAHAQTYNGAFAGTVETGSDVSGYFTGVAGSSLDGQAITGTFRYNAAQSTSTVPGEYLGDSSGGFLSFAITIAGRSYALGSFAADVADIGSVIVTNTPDGISLFGLRSGFGPSELLTLGLMPGSSLMGNGLQGFSGATGSGLFQFDNAAALADGSFTIDDASATLQIAPVPELATWLQMIGGLGLAGVMVRRRRRAAADEGVLAPT